jgi:hypothetical protein
MKMTGHKTNAIFKRYAIVDESLLRELAASLAVPSSKVEGKVDRIPGRGVL